MRGPLEAMSKAIAQSRREIHRLRMLRLFLEQYVPLCYALGWFVRKCYWEGRSRGTGAWARDCLQLGYVVLHGLTGSAASRSPYMPSLAVTLLSWTEWHDDLPAAFFVEESCEAQLSVLGSSCMRHTGSTTVEQVSDLYVNLGPLRGDVHAAGRHPVSAALQRRVTQNLLALKEDPQRGVTYLPWTATTVCTAQEEWPEELDGLPGDALGVSTEAVRRAMQMALQTLARQVDPDPEAEYVLAQRCPLREGVNAARQGMAYGLVESWRLRVTPASRRERDVLEDLGSEDEEPVQQRRRTSAPPARGGATGGHYEESLPSNLPSHPAAPAAPSLGPALVGIPSDPFLE